MGLDMYLRAKRYVSGYDFSSAEDRETYAKIVEIMGEALATGESKGAEVSITTGYWRKANQIHGWFVNHVQNGEDECKEHYVSREKLSLLKQMCLDVLEDNSKAEDLLPPAEGFFFGHYEYDEYYYDQLRYTVELIHRVLNNTTDEDSIYYQSSW
jgi:hypothetical protein